MRVRVPCLIQDPKTQAQKGLEPVEYVTFDEPFLLDGPVCRRVAVLDFDETTGQLSVGAPVVVVEGDEPCTYEIADEALFTARDFMQVNCFATVRATLQLYNNPRSTKSCVEHLRRAHRPRLPPDRCLRRPRRPGSEDPVGPPPRRGAGAGRSGFGIGSPPLGGLTDGLPRARRLHTAELSRTARSSFR